MDILIGTHSFTFNKGDNGGERLSLHTKIFSNGNDDDADGIYLNQELTLQSYGNSATFNLCGAVLTPELLRELAKRLEQTIIESSKILR